jgi:hypothetical protein
MGAQQFKELLAPHMHVLQVGFLQNELLKTVGGVWQPLLVMPLEELGREGKSGGSTLEGFLQVGRCREAKEVALEGDVFCGAGDGACCNVRGACRAVPVSGRYMVQVEAREVEWVVAAVANDALIAVGGNVFVALLARGSFQKLLTWP